MVDWMRGGDSNARSLGYEPNEMATSPPRYSTFYYDGKGAPRFLDAHSPASNRTAIQRRTRHRQGDSNTHFHAERRSVLTSEEVSN